MVIAGVRLARTLRSHRQCPRPGKPIVTRTGEDVAEIR